MVRLKHRYILVNILYPDVKSGNGQSGNGIDKIPYTVQFRQPTTDGMDVKLFTKMIRQGVSELFGDYGSGMIAGSLQGTLPQFPSALQILFKYFSRATSTAIIRVSRDHYRLVWAALSFTNRLPKPLDHPCVMQVVRVSGTIKKAEEEVIRRARLSIKHAQLASLQANGMSHALHRALSISNEPVTPSTGQTLGIEDFDEPDDEDDDDDDDDD